MGTRWGLYDLVAHGPTPSRFRRVTAQILGLKDNLISIEWAVCPSDALFCPVEPHGGRSDDLWRTTCFEAFFRAPGSAAYYEYNFSPSLAWAAYRFDGYRSGMQPLGQRFDPEIKIGEAGYHLAAEFEVPLIEAGWQIALSAVLEDKDGGKSYWALRHPPGAPDFHHADCFALELLPPDAP